MIMRRGRVGTLLRLRMHGEKQHRANCHCAKEFVDCRLHRHGPLSVTAFKGWLPMNDTLYHNHFGNNANSSRWQSASEARHLKHFQQKWIPVLRPEMRKNKNLHRFGVSVKNRNDVMKRGFGSAAILLVC